jgi:hypothetical protein
MLQFKSKSQPMKDIEIGRGNKCLPYFEKRVSDFSFIVMKDLSPAIFMS